MNDVIWRAAAYVVVIFLGFALKKLGLFGPEDYKILSKVLFNVTIPAAILSNVGSLTLESSLLMLILLGMIANIVPLTVGMLLSRRRSNEDKALFGINLPGYNLAAFLLPLAQGFFGPLGVATICIFDIGNAIMCTGGNYVVVQATVNKSKFSVGFLAKNLSRSMPFMTYLVFLPLLLLGIQFPMPIRQVLDVIAPANGFLAMFMIGTAMDIRFSKEYLGKGLMLLGVRYTLVTIMALLIFYITPFPQEVRQTVVLCLFAPLSSMSPVFTERCGGDTALAGFINTLSIPIGVTVIMTLVVAMGA